MALRSNLAFLLACLLIPLLGVLAVVAQEPPPSEQLEQEQFADDIQGDPSEAAVDKSPDTLGWTLRDIAYLVSPLVSLIGVGLIVYFTRKNTISEQWLKINQAEADYLQTKLDKFYGPFVLESEANHLMAQDLASRQPDPSRYRLLDKLFDKEWRASLSPGDKVLVHEICQTGERLSGVIKENSGLVDAEILPYISRAISHFRVLKLAYEERLGGDSEPFLRYVYPKALDRVLDKELKRLQERLALLRQNPTLSHGKLPPLDLSEYPLDEWPDPHRPDFDPSSSTLKPGREPSGRLLSSRNDPQASGSGR